MIVKAHLDRAIATRRSVVLQDASHTRPVRVDLWAPVNGDGARPHGPPPAVVLSHGAFGAAVNYSWLAAHMAVAGYLVAGVSHFGESFIYGAETIDPTSVVRPWVRPADCSFVLDRLLEGALPVGAVAAGRIAAVGHSSGGATALELVGAAFDPGSMRRYCGSARAARDKGCGYARGDAGVAAAVRGTEDPVPDLRDDRVRAVVALDPALGPGHPDESLSAITVPVLVVGAVQNDFLPFEHHAARYAASIPGARLVRLDEGEGHFVFLDEATSDATSNGVPLYRDRPGVDRGAVHRRLGATITDFLDGSL